MKESWIDCYYDALEFFYWEPQHLGRKKHDQAELDSIAKVRKHLRGMEVTLNHNIFQFLALAPDSLRNRLFQLLFGKPVHGAFVMEGRGVDEKYGLGNSTQPDFLFMSDNAIVSIEMKIGAKSSLTQVLKYALLGLAVELHTGARREHFLGYLAASAFPEWKEHYASGDELRQALAKVDSDAFMTKQPSHLGVHKRRFEEILHGMSFGFITYADLAEFLHRLSPPASTLKDSDLVYRKLISGLLKELKARRLASGGI